MNDNENAPVLNQDRIQKKEVLEKSFESFDEIKSYFKKYNVYGQRDLLCDLPKITEPPCKDCRFFRAVVVTDKYGEIDGVRLCHSDRMHWDFGCFKSKKENGK